MQLPLLFPLSEVVVINVDVQQTSEEVRVKSEEVRFVVHFRVYYA